MCDKMKSTNINEKTESSEELGAQADSSSCTFSRHEVAYKVGTRIKELRKNRKMSQASLSEAVNIEPKTVSKHETGVSLPKLEHLIAYSQYFGISIDSLIFDDSPESNVLTIFNICPPAYRPLLLDTMRGFVDSLTQSSSPK